MLYLTLHLIHCFSFIGKLSSEINNINEPIPSLTVIGIHGNEPLQSLTAIHIHGNEPTLPQEMENLEDYVDVGAEGISPLDHPSLANNTDLAHPQDNTIEIHYRAIDADGMDKSEYTDRRKPPHISPKPRGVKSQSLNCQRPFAVTRIGDGETSKQYKKPLPPPKNKDENRAPTLKDESLLQSQRIEQPSKHSYQELSLNTKDYTEMYTCPAELSASSDSIVYAN